MPQIELPFFDPLDNSAIEEYYNIETELEGKPVSIDLNFENSSIDEEKLNTAKKFLQNIPEWLSKNRQYIQDNIGDEDDDTVNEYATFLVEELEPEIVADLIDVKADPDTVVKQVAEKLHLVRIGLYPDRSEDGPFAIFDYTIGREIVDNLIVLNTDENGELEYISMES